MSIVFPAHEMADKRSSASTLDKEASVRVEELKGTPIYNAHIDTSGVDERKLMRKIDLRLIPWLSFLYLLSFLGEHLLYSTLSKRVLTVTIRSNFNRKVSVQNLFTEYLIAKQ